MIKELVAIVSFDVELMSIVIANLITHKTEEKQGSEVLVLM